MHRYEEEVSRMRAILGDIEREVDFRPANLQDLYYLREMLYPDQIVEFYENAEPSSWFEIHGVVLNSIAEIEGENEEAAPGTVVATLGLVNIANTTSGDSFCLDLNAPGDEPPVLLLDHNADYYDMQPAQIRRAAHRVADSFHDFLRKFIDRKLPMDYSEVHHAA